MSTALIGAFVQVPLLKDLVIIGCNLRFWDKMAWMNQQFYCFEEKRSYLAHLFVFQDILDGIEFARGPSNSTWGALRAKMGHSEPFQLYYMAVGNQDCGRPFYRGISCVWGRCIRSSSLYLKWFLILWLLWLTLGNYMKFYSMIKAKYPDIQIISNCDGTYSALDHPADLYDYHVSNSNIQIHWT